MDRSDAADARRLRWLLSGNGYFLEEQNLPGGVSKDEMDDVRREIDEAMEEPSEC